jgi:hypothetical protein
VKIVEVIGATTHRDRANEQLSRNDLEHLAELANHSLIPIFNQHDHALPPVGRLIKNEVREMEGGHWGLYGIWEVWEPGDKHPGGDRQNRKLAIREYDLGERIIGIDGSLEADEFINEVSEIKELGFEIRRERRKAFDPLSVIVVALGVIAGGFLKEIGKDVYTGLKDVFKRVRARDDKAAQRVLFTITVHEGDRKVEIDLILDNATPETIDRLFATGFAQADAAIQGVLKDRSVARAAFRVDQNSITLEYTVDEAGFPSKIVPVDWKTIGGASIGFGMAEAPTEELQVEPSIDTDGTKEREQQ